MYEEYMQNLINYPCTGCMQNTYDMNMENYPYTYSNQNMMGCGYMYPMNTMSESEMESCYPEIYKIVYPMVKKVCMKTSGPINRDVLDNMVEEVCSNVETNDRIELNITVNNDMNKQTCSENRENSVENRQQPRNRGLNDLVRILILRELLGRPNFNQRPMPGGRPPMPWQRPPYPRYEF